MAHRLKTSGLNILRCELVFYARNIYTLELVNQYSSSGMLFWIGLRRSLPWLSRNGEESEGCGLWTDGTDCVMNRALSITCFCTT